MSKYVTRPKFREWSEDLEEDAIDSNIVVHEDDDGPEYSGLLNSRGEKLYRESSRIKMGFKL